MSTILDSVKSYLTPDLIGKVSGSLEENSSNTAKAATGFASAILAGLASKAHEPSFLESIFGTLSHSKLASVLDNPTALLHEGNIAHDDPKDVSGKVLGSIFGGKVPAIISAIAAYAGIKHSSSSSLLGMVGPIVLALLGKRLLSGGLTKHTFGNLLSSEKSSLMSSVPPELASVLGFSAPTANMRTVDELPEPAKRSNWLWPLLLLLALLFAFLYWKGCGKKTAEVVTPIVDTVAAVVEAPLDYAKKLHSGIEIKGRVGGVEDKLIAFIESSSPVDKTTWFSFDRLLFKTDSSEIDMDKSHDQLNNIVEIMKAFPDVNLKIGGYTDSTGNESYNMSLSQARADNVMKALVDMGVDASRLAAEGYGSQYPVATNETPEGRAQNRRIDVRVSKK